MFYTDAQTDTASNETQSEFTAQRSEKNAMLSCFFQAINGLTQGIALFEASGKLVHANAAATTAMEKITWMQSKKVPRSDWLHALVECSSQKAVGLFEFVQSGNTQYIATMPMAVGAQTMVMADFGSQSASIPHAMHYFSKRHGLTGKEHEVLEKLSKGFKPAAIARSHNVSICTINTQLRAIRSKTGCASATALVVKLSRLPILGAMPMQGAALA